MTLMTYQKFIINYEYNAPKKLLRDKTPTMFVDRMLVPWIQENVQVFAKSSKIDVWNKQIQEKDGMIIARDEL